MGKYTIFVWSCYAITLGLMFLNILMVAQEKKKLRERVLKFISRKET